LAYKCFVGIKSPYMRKTDKEMHTRMHTSIRKKNRTHPPPPHTHTHNTHTERERGRDRGETGREKGRKGKKTNLQLLHTDSCIPLVEAPWVLMLMDKA
jgi:hypothetical protein